MSSFQAKVLQQLFKNLTDRQKEVVAGRFGIGKNGPVEGETLDAIGKRFGVTRERVRQIEASALKVIGDAAVTHPLVQDVLKQGKKCLKDVGGVIRKEAMVGNLQGSYEDLHENHLSVLLASSKAFHEHNGDDEITPLYYLDVPSLKKAKAFIAQWASALKAQKAKILNGGYQAEFKNFIKEKKIVPAHAAEYASISKRIHKNSFGDIGLSDWPEINPRTIRDRIYAVMKRNQEPVHFEDIASLINNARFDMKVAIASTVHNELIKDSRFVLVGRGIYGLSEHGYEPGTAREIIMKILKKHGPLRSNEVVLAVQKERLFKNNTILVNLQNREHFTRKEDGAYDIKEA
ncbi:MAG: sigma factor-like helix-turn-helix DNA-binding protein [Patescibacteria group bacterium]